MTSILAFAWRKAHDMNNGLLLSNDEQDFSSPEVTSSSSGETMVNEANEDSIYGTNYDGGMSVPPTPEGLRPRPSADMIRRELNQTQTKLDWGCSDALKEEQEKMSDNGSSGDVDVDVDDEPRTGVVEQSPQRRSVHQPQQTMADAMVLSPQISTSSFYSRSSHSARHVARSPNLKVGKAKTAVGALVAYTNVVTKEFEGERAPPQPQSASILPPRNWLDMMADDGEETGECLLEIKASSLQRGFSSPNRKMAASSRDSQLLDDDLSLHGSPSSIKCHQLHQTAHLKGPSLSNDYALPFKQQKGANLGVFSHTGDICPTPEATARAATQYNPPSVVSPATQSSFMSESMHSLQNYDDQRALLKRQSPIEQEFCQSLRRNRMRNQTGVVEDLVISVLERLQDDYQLVQHVLTISEEEPLEGENLFAGYTKENRIAICRKLDSVLSELRYCAQEEFFMSPSQIAQFEDGHEDLDQALTFCRLLMRTAVPSSEKPDTPQFSLTGLPPQKRKWRCVPGFRSSLGMQEEPRSPGTARGGDTSLFSLPSESGEENTPHTSNVSMTTTITSAFSPEKNSRQFGAMEKSGPHEALKSVVELIGQLSEAIHELLVGYEAVEDMKRIYVDFRDISIEDLKALIDSFELEVIPMQIHRMVSDDIDRPAFLPPASALSQPQPLIRSNRLLTANNETKKFPLAPSESLDGILVDEEEDEINIFSAEEDADDKIDDTDQKNHNSRINMFSPSTEDMRTLGDGNVVDDLRRTVGSFDIEDIGGVRDGPPQRPPAAVINKPARTIGHWKRKRTHQMQLSAE